MKKKQVLLFLGKRNDGQEFVTSDFERAVMVSAQDPIPLNRKTKKAYPKLVKGLLHVETEEHKETTQKQKEKRKEKRKSAGVSRRLNNRNKKAS